MTGFEIAALVAASASAATGAGQAIGSVGANKRRYKWQTKLADYQQKLGFENMDYQWQKSIDSWNMENAYNHPLAQRQRLEQAGLNPALMYSGGGVGNTAGTLQAPSGQSAPDISNTPYTDPYLTGGNYLMQSFDKVLQASLMQAQIGNINADTDKKRGETELQSYQSDYLATLSGLNEEKILSEKVKRQIDKIDLSFMSDTYGFNLQKAELGVRQQKQALEYLSEDIIRLRNENNLFPEKEAQFQATTKQMVMNLVMTEVKIRAEKAGINKTWAEINEIIQNTQKLSAETEHEGYKQLKTIADTDVAKSFKELTDVRKALAELDKSWYKSDKIFGIVDNLVNAYSGIIGSHSKLIDAIIPF